MVTALRDARAIVAEVPDPEVPVVTIDDLGVLRDVTVEGSGRVVVTITPTYSGCPAMEVIAADIRDRLQEAGWPEVDVRTVLSPAWTTDWISERGRRALDDFGIAPPGPAGSGPVTVALGVRCPRCGSVQTREVSRFGSTACKAQWVCRECLEPFDYFKPL